MGNSVVSPCFRPSTNSSDPAVKLIFWEGTTKTVSRPNPNNNRPVIAGEIMFEFPDKILCHADSFFLGRPVPTLSIDDRLVPGQTYFVLPVDFFPSGQTLTASALTSLYSSPRRAPIDFGDAGPFQYVKGDDGRVLMKVLPDFITKIILKSTNKEGCDGEKDHRDRGGSVICSTPELRKRYEQVVGFRDQKVWSPKLDTISENNKIVGSYSPCRFIGLDRKWKEKGN